MTQEPPPDQVPATGDPGDDTARRYRYQSSYAAMLCLEMVAEQGEVAEILCEHHEDVLVKMLSGKFHGIQVKTQQQGGNAWKTTDEQMKSAVDRFAKLESQFPSHFIRYIIASNHPFHRAEASTSFYHVIAQTSASPRGTVTQSFANTIARRVRLDVALVTEMVKKLRLDDGLPKLERITSALRDAIAQCSQTYQSATYADLERAAVALAGLAFRAGSLADSVDLSVYIGLTECPDQAAHDTIMAGKKITGDAVKGLLRKEIQNTPSLVAAEGVPLDGLPDDISVVDKKLTAGGLSATTVAAAKDWRVSAEYLQRHWAAKYGEEVALRRYHHIAALVQTECASAHEECRKPAEVFGACMLKRLRERLQERLGDTAADTYECIDEHLLGHAMIRTHECKVWWSEQFDIARS